MRTGLDVAEALDEAVAAINTETPWKVGESDVIRDANGNQVGRWSVVDPQPLPSDPIERMYAEAFEDAYGDRID